MQGSCSCNAELSDYLYQTYEGRYVPLPRCLRILSDLLDSSGLFSTMLEGRYRHPVHLQKRTCLESLSRLNHDSSLNRSRSQMPSGQGGVL
ncbi:hypothetical protein TNCV_175721 [Trichonephila clavipes]|nr:hypothetical protein TNCV_175721 [Trichonephila clavipes]